MDVYPWGNYERRLVALVAGLSYGPGWEFTLQRVGPELVLAVRWQVPNVHGPGYSSLLASMACTPVGGPDVALRSVLANLWDTIGKLEAHERMERLQFGGNPLYDAHPTGSKGQQLLTHPDFNAPLPV